MTSHHFHQWCLPIDVSYAKESYLDQFDILLGFPVIFQNHFQILFWVVVGIFPSPTVLFMPSLDPDTLPNSSAALIRNASVFFLRRTNSSLYWHPFTFIIGSHSLIPSRLLLFLMYAWWITSSNYSSNRKIWWLLAICQYSTTYSIIDCLLPCYKYAPKVKLFLKCNKSFPPYSIKCFLFVGRVALVVCSFGSLRMLKSTDNQS